MNKTKEQLSWEKVSKLLGDYHLTFGHHWSFNFRNDPKRLAFVLSRYKFAAKMSRGKQMILELGCGEGIGATILGEDMNQYTGVDLDSLAIDTAKDNLKDEKFCFIYDDFMGKQYGKFQSVISLDVVEHIYKDHEEMYFSTLYKNVDSEGVVIVGTPNVTSVEYASEASQLGHVNMFSQQRLVDTMKQYFHQVLPFGMNDEVVHTGFAPMSHYLFCVGCYPKSAKEEN